MRLSELMQGLPILWARGDAEIRGICADSRKVQPGDLFVAIVGRTHDGHQFIADALARGAVAILADSRSVGVPAAADAQPRSVGVPAADAQPRSVGVPAAADAQPRSVGVPAAADAQPRSVGVP
ncbi:MAG: Mur ligase domain-containing protein, partial [Fimbriimonadales bacterium]